MTGLVVGLGVVLLVGLALRRIDLFVLVVLLVRTSLDAVRVPGPAGLDPAALLGILLLGTASTWLLATWRREGWPRLSPLALASLAFAGAGLVGVAVAPAYAVALVEWTRLASIAVTLLVVERLAASATFRRRLVLVLLLAAVVPLSTAAVQVVRGEGLFEAGGFDRAVGTFTHPNPFAAYLSIVVVVALAQVVHRSETRLRLVCAAVAVLASLGLLATYTRGAWLAALLGVAVVVALRQRRLLLGVAGALVVVLLLVPGIAQRFGDLGDEESLRGEPGNSLTWRFEYWSEALDLASESPVTGIGLKQVAGESLEGKQPHNDFLRAYVEMGLLGLLAFTLFVSQLVRTAVRGWARTRGGPVADRALAAAFAGVAAGYVLMSAVANLMSQVVVGVYLAALAGCVSALVQRGTDPAPGPVPNNEHGRPSRAEEDPAGGTVEPGTGRRVSAAGEAVTGGE
ncbi:O-antigen ligase family protein [Nocardioides kribbensis]|uniref:O-antigen ligase family protein n=1 Tax=Nocardioides kribbensis TaxID=305517 RepID=UPI0032DB5B3B